DAADLVRAWVQTLRLRIPSGLPAAKIIAHPLMEGVAGLDLSRCGLGDVGVRPFLTSERLARVRRLDLSGNELTDASVAALIAAPFCPALHRLDLGNNRIGPAGAHALLAAAGPRLADLDLGGNPVADDVLRRLEARRFTDSGPGRPARIFNSVGL